MRPDLAPQRRPSALLVLLLALGLAFSVIVQAQEAQPTSVPLAQPAPESVAEPAVQADPKAPAGPAVELDLARLLFDSQGLTVQDKVWSLPAEPGRRLVLLPLLVQSLERDVELSRSPYKVRAGRFVAYYLPKDRADGGRAPAVDLNQLTDASADVLGKLLLGGSDDGQPDGAELGPDQPDEDAGEEPGADEDLAKVPEGAPRLTRSVVLRSDGTIQWEMDRSFSGATLATGSEANLYPYKLDVEQLRSKEPERGERISRNEGEDARDYAARKRERQVADREAQAAYRELRDKLRDLPTEFREPAPQVIYVVYNVATSNKLTFEGPPPLPWVLASEDFEHLTKLSRITAGTDDADATLKALAELVGGHPLNDRAVALAAYKGQLAGKVEKDDAGYKLLEALLASSDQAARRISVYGVAMASPPTLASAQLLEPAARSAGLDERKLLQFASLKKVIELESSEPNDTALVIAKVNQLIEDPDGPDAQLIVEQLLSSQSNASNRGAIGEPGLQVKTLINEMRFDALTEEETPRVITTVIQNAPSNRVAAGWLDKKLLRSEDAGRANKTLELLTQAGVAVPDQPVPAVVLDGSAALPLDAMDHGLIVALDSDDAARRALAWDALRHFAVASMPSASLSEPNEADEPSQETQLFELVLAKAMDQPQTPLSIIKFIDNQRDAELQRAAPRYLMQLLADEATGEAVLKALGSRVLASEGRYSTVIQAMEPEEQIGAIGALYFSQGQEAPLMIGMLAEKNSGLTSWLMRAIGDGQLPDAAQWARQAGGENGPENALVKKAASTNGVAAYGAAAGLAISMGGDLSEQERFAQAVADLSPRTEEAVAQAWSQERTAILTRIFGQARGTYRLTLTAYDKQPAQQSVESQAEEPSEAGEGEPKPPAGKRIELGLVELRAVGAEVSLSVQGVTLSVPPSRLAIRVDALSALVRSFEAPALSDLDLTQVTEPVDLEPGEGGVWSGGRSLRDGKWIVVSLEPAG